MEKNVEVVCLDCDASYGIVTDMDTTKYKVECCTFCGSGNIEVEQEEPEIYEDDEN